MIENDIDIEERCYDEEFDILYTQKINEYLNENYQLKKEEKEELINKIFLFIDRLKKWINDQSDGFWEFPHLSFKENRILFYWEEHKIYFGLIFNITKSNMKIQIIINNTEYIHYIEGQNYSLSEIEIYLFNFLSIMDGYKDLNYWINSYEKDLKEKIKEELNNNMIKTIKEKYQNLIEQEIKKGVLNDQMLNNESVIYVLNLIVDLKEKTNSENISFILPNFSVINKTQIQFDWNESFFSLKLKVDIETNEIITHIVFITNNYQYASSNDKIERYDFKTKFIKDMCLLLKLVKKEERVIPKFCDTLLEWEKRHKNDLIKVMEDND